MPADQSEVRTLQGLIEDRRRQQRTMSIHVQGDPSEAPPENRALAVRVAHLLKDGEGSIVEPEEIVDPDDLPSQSVLLFTKGDSETWVEWAERTAVRQLLQLARVEEVHIVIHAERVPQHAEGLLDARVYSTTEIATIEVDAFNEDVYERALEGLTSNAC